MATDGIEGFGKALRQRLGGANQVVHARDMENGDVQVTARMLPWLGLERK